MAEHIKVGAVEPRIQYVADGAQTAFPFPFMIFKATDLEVFVGAAQQASGYTVAGVGLSDGGTVSFSPAPASGQTITLRRKLTIERMTDFQEGGAFRAKDINDALDFHTAALQELEADLGRAVRLAPTVGNAVSVTLPPSAPGKALGWSDDGTALVNDPSDFASTAGVIQQWSEDADQSRQDADAAASQAQGSANTAAISATAAQNAAADAGVERNAAAVSADGAASSAALSAEASRQAEAAHLDAALDGWLIAIDRQQVLASATSAETSATTAEGRAAETLKRLDDADLWLWNADLAARTAERHAATTTVDASAVQTSAATATSEAARAEAAADKAETAAATITGFAPASHLPNWARIDT